MRGCRPLTQREVKKIVKVWNDHNPRNKALFLLGLYSGLRIKELLSLKVKDIYNGNEIATYLYIERRNMKGKKEGKQVILNERARQVIADLLKAYDYKPDDYLFLSQKGKGMLTRQQAWNILRSAFKKANVQGKVACHTLRKTFADRIYENSKGDIFLVGNMLGHKNIKTTVSYLEFKQEKAKKVISQLDFGV